MEERFLMGNLNVNIVEKLRRIKMGLYNTYGNIQIKCGNYEEFKTYKIGDKCDLKDGIYIGLSGAIVIKNKIFIAEFDNVYDKWGNRLSCADLINPNHPLKDIFKKEK